MLKDPRVRLALRALLAAALVFAAQLQQNATINRSGITAAGTAALWTFLEAFTPLNQSVKLEAVK